MMDRAGRLGNMDNTGNMGSMGGMNKPWEGITLRAILRDADVWRMPASLTGTVHSVYRSTINIALTHVEGRLLSLGVRLAVLSPGMAVIDQNVDFRDLDASIKQGKQVEIIGNYLILSDHVRCDLSTAHPVSLALPVYTEEIAAPGGRAKQITAWVKRYGKPGGAGRPWLLLTADDGGADPPEELGANHALDKLNTPIKLDTLHEKAFYHEVQRLAHVLHFDDESALYEALAAPVGMGIGLTPTADDFATGCLGLLLAARPSCREWAGANRTRWLADIQEKTTFLGYEMLHHVLHGAINQAALDVITACLHPQAWEWEARVQRLLSLGSTSGTDMLCGIAFGLHALQVWKRREEYAYTNSCSEERLP
jgi:hypothetical protein